MDVIIGEGTAVVELLTGEDKTLLVGRDPFLVLDLSLYVIDCIRTLDFESDGLACEGFHEDLHLELGKMRKNTRKNLWEIFMGDIFLLLVLFLLAGVSSPSETEGSEGSKLHQPFNFLHQLVGSQKGGTVKGLHELKQYLERFGYLINHDRNAVHDDDFDDRLEFAVRTYQLNYHLNVTGKLDRPTVAQMMMPRCGVADILRGTTWMRAGKMHDRSPTKFHTVSHFSFFSRNQSWPPYKSHLSYGFVTKGPVDVRPIWLRSFARWSAVSHFTFEEVQDVSTADITIGFFRLDHGDGVSFDGPGGVLAHSFAPASGLSHFDADEHWATDLRRDAIDLESVAMHEIGHLLGLQHTSIEGAVMYPSIPKGVRKLNLHGDDVLGIKTLYNLN